MIQQGLKTRRMKMNGKLRKVAILGSGNVGSHCGLSLALKGEADEIVFIDIKKEKAEGEALDLRDASSFLPHRVTIRAGETSDCGDCDVVIVSAGPLPRPDQDRLDTLEETITSLGNSIIEIVEAGFSGIFVCISNPADVIADYVRKSSGFPKNRVFSTGTSLDSSRLKRILSRETGLDVNSINAFSMGEHGGSQMIPWSHVNLGGKPILDLIEDNPETYGTLDLDSILDETRFAGYAVLIGKGSTEFGISTAATDIIKAILHDEKRILPVSVLLEGEYGVNGVHASVPAVIGKNGVEQIVQLRLTEDEEKLFNKSCSVIGEYIGIADKLSSKE